MSTGDGHDGRQLLQPDHHGQARQSEDDLDGHRSKTRLLFPEFERLTQLVAVAQLHPQQQRRQFRDLERELFRFRRARSRRRRRDSRFDVDRSDGLGP